MTAGADVDPGPVVVSRAFRAVSGALTVPGRGGQVAGDGIGAGGSAAVVDPHLCRASDGRDTADAARLECGAELGAWP